MFSNFPKSAPGRMYHLAYTFVSLLEVLCCLKVYIKGICCFSSRCDCYCCVFNDFVGDFIVVYMNMHVVWIWRSLGVAPMKVFVILWSCAPYSTIYLNIYVHFSNIKRILHYINLKVRFWFTCIWMLIDVLWVGMSLHDIVHNSN